MSPAYTAANDLRRATAERRPKHQRHPPFKADWTKHKTFDGSCPLGPWIVPASDIGDPQNLGLKLWVNDVLKAGLQQQGHDLQPGRANWRNCRAG